MTHAPARRVLQLDVLRGVAIALVIGRHGINDVGDLQPITPFVDAWYRFGWSGVDLFFVLSGFLIGGLIFAEIRATDTLDVKRFYVRRAFKILPLYYLFLLLAAVMLKLRVGGPPTFYARTIAKSFISNGLNVQNYFGTLWPHTWSLAVEEHFYLSLPLILWWFGIRGRDATAGKKITSLPVVPIAAGLAVLVCTGLRAWSRGSGPFTHDDHLAPTHLRIDGLYFGVLLAYLYHFRPDFVAFVARRRRLLLALGLLLVSPMLFLTLETDWFVPTFGYAFLYVGYGLVMLALVTTPLGEGWLGKLLASGPARLLALVGYYSYPVYLFHIDFVREPLLVLLFTPPISGLPPILRWGYGMIVFAMMSWLIGVFFTKLIENRVLATRDRLFPTPVKTVPPASIEPEPAEGAALASAPEAAASP